jgi:predicted nucleotidyltransferase
MTGNVSAPSKALIANALRRIPFIDAAALYGSAARGDMELHSDIDVLLLCAPGQKRTVYEFAHPALSYEFPKISLTLYSDDELDFLNRARSLFLLHLKREAEILFDYRGFLHTLLSGFREKESYHCDFIDSLTLIDPLLTKVADSPNQLHRLSYTYSLFRVFGVYLLAERRIFEFSKSKMTTSLSREYPLAGKAISLLSNLRSLNSNFFTGGTRVSDWIESWYFLEDCVSALCEVAGIRAEVRDQSYKDAVAELERASCAREHANYKLRTWFLLLAYDGLNLFRRNNGQPPLVSFDPSKLEEMIAAPQPPAVTTAALQALECIRNYRAKYFLNSRANLSMPSAVAVLASLGDEI